MVINDKEIYKTTRFPPNNFHITIAPGKEDHKRIYNILLNNNKKIFYGCKAMAGFTFKQRIEGQKYSST